MEYRDYIGCLARFGFIADERMADSALKSALGRLANEMQEPAAREMTKNMPVPLTYDRLRGHLQKESSNISFQEYLQEIATQFRLSLSESTELIDAVLRFARNEMDRDTADLVLKSLPLEWARAVAHAWQ